MEPGATDAAMMELSCREVPLYGQITVYAKFDKTVPEDAEFYFVYSGSVQRHVVFAMRVTDNSLESVIPAHGKQEEVAVSVVMYTKEDVPVTLGFSSVTYKLNKCCELARFFVSQAGCLTSSSHLSVLSRFGVTVEDLQSLDHDVMLAMVHETIPLAWNTVGNNPEGVIKHKETLLHLTMRMGLVKLSQFLLCQPGGRVAVTLPNEDGFTPLDLAVQNGHNKLAELISRKQLGHLFEISKVEPCDGAVLQFAHSSGTLTLTFNRIADHLLESDIQLFRKYFWDRAFLHKVLAQNQAEILERGQMTDSSTFSTKVPQHSPFETYRKTSNPSTFFASARLSALLNGSDEVYANRMVVHQMEDAGVKYTDEDHSVYETHPNQAASNESLDTNSRNSSPVTASNLDTAGSFSPFKKLPAFSNQRNLRYPIMKKRSSSLDDLDVDSGNERISNRTHDCYPPMSFNSPVASSRDMFSSSEAATVSKAESLPLSNNLQPKEVILSGIRSRSYSYTAPKVLLEKSHSTRDFTLGNTNDERASSMLEHSREKRIHEEEWDKYIIPTKSESEKCKVSRTFSFLMNRMASTRNKSKGKNKDTKEKEKLNKHQFASSTFTGVMPCFSCDKPLLGKESLQCSYCSAVVHRSCKDCAPLCTKKFQERCHSKNKSHAVPTNPSFRDIPQPTFSTMHPSTSAPIGLSTVKKDTLQQPNSLSKSVPSTGFERKCISPLEPDTETSSWRSRSHSEELLQSIGTASSVDSFIIEDDEDDDFLWSELNTDALEFEAESWSLVVEASFCNKQEKDVIKRQDVIFELMQTEMHHIHTLFIMSKIFRKGMKKELQLDHSTVDKIFPCLDELLELHQKFFCSMKERRQESCQEGSDRNFVISRIGDILVQQFSEENANKMQKIYGEFCSHHKEAVSIFKELQQNKKFQNFIKLRNNNLLARRRGIPECILLVTQRITKYPVLVERILQYTKEGTEEHQDLCKALCLIKDMIAAVDLQVNEYEKKQKLLEILSKIENKTYTKLKNGHIFRKQDLMKKQTTLLHEGLVYWKTATGRFKDILALLLNDVMLFLQEKDQKYIFAAVDQKPAVIGLQKLIVREVANEERGMFLISASSTGPEMYEIHTASKEERSHWMRQVQEAVESCPEEEGKMSESDDDRRIAEARATKIQKCQVILNNQDQQICSCLEDKLNIYAELGDMSGFADVPVEPHLLIKPDSGETPQVASLLTAALREAENLHVAVTSAQMNDTDHLIEENTEELCLMENLSEAEVCEPFTDSMEEKDLCDSDVNDTNNVAETDLLDQEEGTSISAPAQYEIVQTIQNLTRLLYSIQAALTIQDSHIEIHKLLLQEHERASWSQSPRSLSLLEQEKHRHFKPKEELANISKLQQQFLQEQQRWSRECDQKQQEYEARETRLLEKEKECLDQEELLGRKREELDVQLQDYQQNLERLRESQRMVEKEQEMVRLRQKILHHWKHTRQSSLPAVISAGNNKIIGHNQLDSFCGESSVFLNEAIIQMSLNHLNKSNSTLVYQDNVHCTNLPNSCLSTTENQVNLNTDISHQQAFPGDLSNSPGSCCLSTNYVNASSNHCCVEGSDNRMSSASEHPVMNSDILLKSQMPKYQDSNAFQRPWSLNRGDIQPQHLSDVLPHHLSCDLGQDSENGDTEEKIVYL